MSPEQIAAAGTEHSHQAALFCWAAQNSDKYPELKWMYAIPNGGQRDMVTASRLKAEGVKSGVSDVCLPVARDSEMGRYHGLYIEMKKPGGRESQNQKDFGAFLAKQGYFYTMCDHWEEARDTIIAYFDPLVGLS